tara:strand:+ start:278 stop:406 length:129 start_codon:yes stop_codon:yes gene_type:complete
MESLGTLGFCLAIFGIIAFIRLEKLIKTLKKKGILDKDYKKE